MFLGAFAVGVCGGMGIWGWEGSHKRDSRRSMGCKGLHSVTDKAHAQDLGLVKTLWVLLWCSHMR